MEEGQPITSPLLLDDANPNMNSSGDCNSPAGHSPITRVLVLSTLVAICGSASYGCAVGYSSPAESGIIEDLGLSVAAYSVFGSIMTIGGVIGAILSGKIADLIGRKRVKFLGQLPSKVLAGLAFFFLTNSLVVLTRQTMGLSQVLCTPGWLAIACAENAWWLDIGRLLIGVGVGLITYVVPIHIAEITPKNIRGRFTSGNTLMIGCSFAVLFAVGNVISWRPLSLLAAIPSVVQFIGLFFIPESPRWLAKIGRDKESEAALRQLRGENVDISQEALDIKEMLETFQYNPESRLRGLFQGRYVYPIIVGVGLMLLQQLSGNSAMLYYSSSIFAKAGFSPTIGTTVVAILQIPATIVAVLLMDKYGRRTLLLVSSLGNCIFMSLMALSFLLQELHCLKEFTPTLAFIGFLGYAIAFSIGMSGIPWVIMSEIFPINVKAAAGSLVTLTNWSSSWLMTYTFNFMMQWSSPGTFFFFTGTCGLTALFVWKLAPETRGRTLEEIQAAIACFRQEVC